MDAIVKFVKKTFDSVQGFFEPVDYLKLWFRLWVGQIFYLSGRSKAGENFFEINDFQGTLFEEEYGISFVDPELMAQLALYAETLFPLMIIAGLGARIGAAGLLAMTLFIQLFIYPGHFIEHATWMAVLIPLMLFGAGKISLDHIISGKLK